MVTYLQLFQFQLVCWLFYLQLPLFWSILQALVLVIQKVQHYSYCCYSITLTTKNGMNILITSESGRWLII